MQTSSLYMVYSFISEINRTDLPSFNLHIIYKYIITVIVIVGIHYELISISICFYSGDICRHAWSYWGPLRGSNKQRWRRRPEFLTAYSEIKDDFGS